MPITGFTPLVRAVAASLGPQIAVRGLQRRAIAQLLNRASLDVLRSSSIRAIGAELRSAGFRIGNVDLRQAVALAREGQRARVTQGLIPSDERLPIRNMRFGPEDQPRRFRYFFEVPVFDPATQRERPLRFFVDADDPLSVDEAQQIFEERVAELYGFLDQTGDTRFVEAFRRE